MSRITFITWVIAIGTGCAGTGDAVEERSVALETADIQDLYSADGCAELRASDLDLLEMAVEGRDELHALVSEGTVLCVLDAGALEGMGAPIPLSEMATVELATQTMGGEDVDPDPQPLDPDRSGEAEDPDPQPLRPTTATYAPLR